MNQPQSRGFLAVTLIALMLCGHAYSAPENMSLDAYEQAKQNAARRAEQRTRLEFKDRIDEIEALSQAGRLGENISVRRVRGAPPVVTGRLYEVTPGRESYARIGDYTVNLSDVVEVDRQRVLMALKTEKQIAAELGDKRAALDDVMEQRAKKLTEIMLVDDGYTEDFLATAIRLAGRFYMPDDLGDRRGTMILRGLPRDEDPYQQTFNIRMSNGVQTVGLAVLLVDDRPVYVTFPDEREPQLTAATWDNITFVTDRALMDPEPARMVPEICRLVVYAKNLGRWEMRPQVSRGRGTQDLAAFTWVLDQASIRPYSAAMDAEFAAQVTGAREHAQKVRDRLAADLLRWEEEKVAAATAAAAAAEATGVEVVAVDPDADLGPIEADPELIRKRQEIVTQLDRILALWYTQKNPPPEELQYAQYLAGKQEVGNPNSPLTVDGQKVIAISPWIDTAASLRSDDRTLNFIGVKYRFLQLTPHPDTQEPRFLLHAVTLVENRSDQIILATPAINVEFTSSDRYAWMRPQDFKLSVSHQFRILPTWWGHVGLYQYVPAELVALGVLKEKVSLKLLDHRDASDAAATSQPPAEADTP